MKSERYVGNVMHRGIIGCRPTTPLEEVVRIMADTNLQVIVVTGSHDEAVGIISQLDVLPYFDRDLKGLKAGEVMSGTLIAVAPDMPLAEAVKIMVERKITHLVVSERGDAGLRALGVLTSSEVIREMRGSKWMWYLSPEP